MRQLASRGRLSSHRERGAYSVLAAVSNCYSQHQGRSSTRYSPVRHSTRGRSPFRVRLACVKHAASVQSEPESNSPVQNCQIPAAQKSEFSQISKRFPTTRYSLFNERPGFRPAPILSARRLVMLHSSQLVKCFLHFAEKSFRRTVKQTSEGKQIRPDKARLRQIFLYSVIQRVSLPRWRRAFKVAIRPRGVRCNSPICIRYGS